MIKVSVIIPIYNSESYLEETIESVLGQDLKGIEIILIDDGSTDKSIDICNSYANKHNNIKVISQKNLGPGVARNKGVEVAKGEYVTFLDSDDLIPKDIFKKVYTILKETESDIFIGNILCFDDVRQWHLHYMKKVFLNKGEIKTDSFNKMPEINYTPSVCNKWFKLSMLKNNNIIFNENIKVGEDLLFTQEAFINAKKIVTKDIDIYNYRIINKESLIKKSNIEFFGNLLEVQRELIKLYKNMTLNRVILLRQIEFFIDSILLKIHSIVESEIYKVIDLGMELLQISKDIEFERDDFRSIERYFLAILLKNGDKENALKLINMYLLGDFKKSLIIEDNQYFSYLYKDFKEYKNILIQKPEIESKVENSYITKDNKLILRGYAFVRGLELENKNIIKRELILKGKETEIVKKLENDYRTDLTYLFRGDYINYNWGGYKPIEISLEELKDDEYEVFQRVIIDNRVFSIPFEFRLAEVRNKLKVRYINNIEVFCRFNGGKYLNIRIKHLSKKSYIKSKLRKIKRDIRYDFSLIKRKKYKSFLALIIYKLFGWYFRSKNIWLMGERKDTAQDNTYHLFKYIKENEKNVNTKYVITKDSKDLSKIKSYGDIVWFNSIMHTVYLLTCKFTINSYVEKPNMYTKQYIDIIKYYPEFVRNKKVFLQHGVIGVSRVNHVLHKNKVDYDYFVVSSEFEKNHIIEEFGYDENEVIVTGLPRWDNLNNKAKKNKILLMPTWRSWIKSEEELLESNYFKTYLEFINSEKLHKVLEEKGYELTFYPHYQTQKLLNKININLNKNINIVRQGEKSVQELINENYILITDYSTVAFDFAYSNKPVIFFQFDYDEFYSKHYNEGPINHKNELFGVRVEGLESLLGILDENLNNLELKNINRYIFKSNNHCKEVFNYIKNKIGVEI
jgi:glycosyltransferase involved in cell wall biosynthesis/CDP-glycerol glycerophosphotransferase (TagB/SpsB family)